MGDAGPNERTGKNANAAPRSAVNNTHGTEDPNMPNERIINERRTRVNNLTANAFLVGPAHNSREASAWHEAAHAVVAELFDYHVRYASIVPEEGYLGHCQLDGDGSVPLPGLPRAITYIGHSLAGHAVEIIRDTMPLDAIPKSDIDALKPVLLPLCKNIGRDPEESFWVFLQMVVELVSQEPVWKAIEQVTAVLLDRDVIQGDQIRRIVRDAGLTVFSEREQIGLALALAGRR